VAILTRVTGLKANGPVSRGVLPSPPGVSRLVLTLPCQKMNWTTVLTCSEAWWVRFGRPQHKERFSCGRQRSRVAETLGLRTQGQQLPVQLERRRVGSWIGEKSEASTCSVQIEIPRCISDASGRIQLF
jgi:hypothetical protein